MLIARMRDWYARLALANAPDVAAVKKELFDLQINNALLLIKNAALS